MKPRSQLLHQQVIHALRFILTFFVALGIISCATSASRLSNVRVGMTKQEVVHILGEPYSSEVRDGGESLYFNLSTDRVAEGLFIGVMRPLNIGKQFYKIEFVNGRVRSYYPVEKP